MYLGNLTTTQAQEEFKKDPVIVIPVGSTEVHGTQSALGTDYRVPDYLAGKIADMEGVIVAPTMPYGVCPYHQSFAGSINIGYEGLYVVLHGITDSLMQHGARRFVVLNGHGGNTPSIDRAALEVYHKGGLCASIDWWSLVAELDDKFRGGHGDILETSVMMAIEPDSVHLELCRPMNAGKLSEAVSAAYIQAVKYRGGTVRLVRDTKENAPAGWFGPFDPKDSTAALGQAALDLAVDYIRGFLEEMKTFECPAASQGCGNSERQERHVRRSWQEETDSG